MDAKQNPFSLYDFLGYFTPGAVFLYGFVAIVNRFFNYDLHDSFTRQGFNSAEISVALVLSAYIVGHALSFLSSILVEKFSIWMHGYPSKYLLNAKHCGYTKNVGNDGKETKVPRFSVCIRLGIWVFMLPVSLLDLLLGKLLNARNTYVKGLDFNLEAIIRTKVDALLIEHSGLKKPHAQFHWYKDDFFRFALHYAVVNSEHHLVSIKNYIALYGFTRTMTFLCVLCFWISLFLTLSNNVVESNVIRGVLVMSFFASYIYYMAFNKFSRRYTLEVFMAVAITYDVKDNLKRDPNTFIH